MKDILIFLNGPSIAIRVADLKIIKALEINYKHMIIKGSDKIIRRIEVIKNGSGYSVTGNAYSELKANSYQGILDCLESEIVLSFIALNNHLLLLHAGAVAKEGKAIMIVASSCMGKSSLIAELCRKGWEYLSDEIVGLDMGTGLLYSFQRSIQLRSDIKGKELCIEQLNSKNAFIPHKLYIGESRLTILIFPFFSLNGRTCIEKYPSFLAMKDILENCLNYSYHKYEAFRYIAEMSNNIPLRRLPYSEAQTAARLILEDFDNGMEKKYDLY